MILLKKVYFSVFFLSHPALTSVGCEICSELPIKAHKQPLITLFFYPYNFQYISSSHYKNVLKMHKKTLVSESLF